MLPVSVNLTFVSAFDGTINLKPLRFNTYFHFEFKNSSLVEGFTIGRQTGMLKASQGENVMRKTFALYENKTLKREKVRTENLVC